MGHTSPIWMGAPLGAHGATWLRSAPTTTSRCPLVRRREDRLSRPQLFGSGKRGQMGQGIVERCCFALVWYQWAGNLAFRSKRDGAWKVFHSHHRMAFLGKRISSSTGGLFAMFIFRRQATCHPAEPDDSGKNRVTRLLFYTHH